MNYVMQHYCIGPLLLDAGCLVQYVVLTLLVQMCVRIRMSVCEREGLLRDVTLVGGVLAHCARSISTPPHRCNAAGLSLSGSATTYRMSRRRQ